jgi:hypothetical protein
MSDMNSSSDSQSRFRGRSSGTKFRLSEELKIVPTWSYVLGIVLFTAVEFLGPILRRHDAHPMPLPALICVMTFVGLLMIALSMMVGYVNRDAKRRGMSPTLWTILVLVVPNAIGYIIYFLAREPLVYGCPQCQTPVNAKFNFCPKCKYNLHPACPECKHEIRPGDRFCPFCAHDLSVGPTAEGNPLNPLTPGATA